MSSTRSANAYQPFLFALVLLMGIYFGFILKDYLRGEQLRVNNGSSVAGTTFDELEQVMNFIDHRYVDEVDKNELMETAIRNTLTDLDPHSNYISPAEIKEVNESLQGNFEGIGVEFFIVKDTITVVSPISGGPSEKLGIMAGDKIVQIEDTLVAGIGLQNKDVVSRLRGEKGTEVKVSIYRKGVDELLDFTIVRDKIPLVSLDVNYMVDDETGYIKINRFSATTFQEFMDAMYALRDQGMKKLILDLRQNPGGYLNAAVNMADEFIAGKGQIVYTEGTHHNKNEYKARRRGTFEEEPLVVLIDEGSASASEIVSGAVQDWDRGMVIGRRSFGKGLVQEQYDLNNGGALRLTVARYYTPSGRCIQKPYEEGRDAYRNELNERFENGELGEQDSTVEKLTPDSLIFKTLLKEREVHGGGGIEPDVFVPIDTTGMEPFLIRARSLIPQFVYDYFSNNRAAFEQYKSFDEFNTAFKVDGGLIKKYQNFLKAELDNDLYDRSLLLREESDIKILIKAHLARQMWRNEGYYPLVHQMDPVFKRALEAIEGL